MKFLQYPAILEPGDESGIVVTFPDVPEAITQGDDTADAIEQAEEALGLALTTYPERGKRLPAPSPCAPGQVMIAVEPSMAAKIAVLDAFAAAGVTKTALANTLGVSEKEIRMRMDPFHRTKIGPLAATLEALGKRLVIGIEDAA
ncbi:type II toxin-antitoxin system HicB family antitoxin [Breoghania sp.]|uniref:type II toxin-antitoxin system HicB family antitoxin n=1 Tax=Breoghania sp. TaxID=2065378 RepID=UPI002AA7CB46|nr:type II toxin-antitoxin system HicB family antitoxin [Breoghania sp.]